MGANDTPGESGIPSHSCEWRGGVEKSYKVQDEIDGGEGDLMTPDKMLHVAIEEARKGLKEGGIPVGAAI